MATKSSLDVPLESLQAMVNLVLGQTGQVFKSISIQDPRALQHVSSQMNEAVPGALARYHLALDQIEIEIVRAKAVFEQKLAQSRARKEEAARKESEKASLNQAKESVSETQKDSQKKDIEMADAPPSTKISTPKPPPISTTGPSPSRPPLPASQSKDKAADPKPQPSLTSPTFTNETPATAGLGKMDLDSMFPSMSDDSGPGGEHPDLDFSLDFSTDAGADAGLLSNDFGIDGGEALPAAGDDPPTNDTSAVETTKATSSAAPDASADVTAPANDGTDLASILPDVEAFPADSAAGLGDLGLAADQALGGGSAGGAEGTDAQDLMPAESNFDDLFFDEDFGMGGGGDGMGSGGNLDDSFFGLGEDSK